MDASDKDLLSRAASLAKAFQSTLKGTFELDPAITEVNVDTLTGLKAR